MDEIQQSYDAGQYQDTIRKIAVVLPLKGEAAAAYDRGTLLALKAESHVQLKQFGMASDAFAMAAKQIPDESQNAIYRASAILMKRSQTGRYLPKRPTTQQADPKARPGPIDVIDAASRKQALAALFNDESNAVLARLGSVQKQQSLVPVMTAIRQVGELRALELAGTGGTETCKQALTALGEHANQLMAGAVKKMSDNTEALASAANQTTTQRKQNSDGSVEVITRKRGLTSVDKNALQDVIATCGNISQACDELAAALGAEGTPFAGSRQLAAALQGRAEDVLKTNYEPVVTREPTVVTPRTSGNPGSR